MHYKIKTFYRAWINVFDFFDNYSTIVSEVKLALFNGKRLKILNPKQMLQRLLIALAQVKAGNTSIKQHFLCIEETKSKKVCHNIMNSVKW